MRSTTFAFLVMGQLLAAETALACSFLPPEAHSIEVDPSDVSPPTAPQTDVDTSRYPEEHEGCGKVQSNSCHGSGSLDIAVQASDDITAAGDLGYLIDVVEGDVDFAGSLLQGPMRARDGHLYLQWDDGDGLGKVDFELEIWTVDRAGNMSDSATRVRVQLSEKREGCATLSGSAGMPWLLLVAVWLWRRRK